MKATMELINAQSTKTLPPLVMDPKFAQSGVAEEHGDRGEVQRAGTLHVLHRLRVDLERGRRRQPAPQRDSTATARTRLIGCCRSRPPEREPEDLWKWMAEWEKTTGGKMLAIPHNGNLSNGACSR